eukprot:NODE_872_length_3382_cov_0.843131.p5 type:complete len:116 gc:universal NODE_872_length_3382_cov_0.843131:781-434(-)
MIYLLLLVILAKKPKKPRNHPPDQQADPVVEESNPPNNDAPDPSITATDAAESTAPTSQPPVSTNSSNISNAGAVMPSRSISQIQNHPQPIASYDNAASSINTIGIWQLVSILQV